MKETSGGPIRYRRLTSAIANGVRAAIATLIPFFLAAAFHRPELAWMALGGWLGTLVDPGGLRSTRALTVGSFALLGALVVPLAELCAGSTWLATAVLASIVFTGTLARALGPAAATVGTMTAIVAAVGTAKGGSTRYALDALAFAAGALWATVLSSMVWPVSRHRPVRVAVASAFETMADYARVLAASAPNEEAGTHWAELAVTHHRRIRAAIEEALAMSLAIRATSGGETAVGADLRVLLGLAEAQFPRLVALAVELEGIDPGGRPARAGATLRSVAETYEAIHASLVSKSTGAAARPAMASAADVPQVASAASLLLDRLVVESEDALVLAKSLGAGANFPGETEQRRPRGRVLQLALAGVTNDLRELRDALSFESVFFRHAIRVTMAAVVASVVGHLIASRPQWVTITTIAVLQPYAGPTAKRGLERVIGTVLGSAVAAIITISVQSPLALAAVMFPLSVAAVATRGRSYRLFTFFLTPVFVLISERHPGDWWTAAARSGDALAGGAIALVAALAFWPSWEKTRLPDAIDRMVTAVLSYRDAVVTSLDLHGPEERAAVEPAIAAARRAAGIAIGEAETSLERWMAEPLRSAEEGESAMQLVTHARRLANTCTALDVRALHGVRDPAAREGYLHAIETYEEALARRASLFANEVHQ